VSFGFLLMTADWPRSSGRGEWLRLAMAHSDTLRLPEPILGGFGPDARSLLSSPCRVNPGFVSYLERKYHKVVHLVDFMAACGATGSAEAVVEACEVFASGSARQWLKIAGDEKAILVDSYLIARPDRAPGVVAEFGAFVGYSCVRMARRADTAGRPCRVVSLEADAVHVAVARHTAREGRQSMAVEVWPGLAHDSVRRLADEWGHDSVAFAFMDHRGTRFHCELAALQRLRLLPPGAQFLADNTLKPGAPVLLWNFEHMPSPAPAAAINWSVPEFISSSCEDWMTAWDGCL